jgi:hypothetical protein
MADSKPQTREAPFGWAVGRRFGDDLGFKNSLGAPACVQFRVRSNGSTPTPGCPKKGNDLKERSPGKNDNKKQYEERDKEVGPGAHVIAEANATCKKAEGRGESRILSFSERFHIVSQAEHSLEIGTWCLIF